MPYWNEAKTIMFSMAGRVCGYQAAASYPASGHLPPFDGGRRIVGGDTWGGGPSNGPYPRLISCIPIGCSEAQPLFYRAMQHDSKPYSTSTKMWVMTRLPIGATIFGHTYSVELHLGCHNKSVNTPMRAIKLRPTHVGSPDRQ